MELVHMRNKNTKEHLSLILLAENGDSTRFLVAKLLPNSLDKTTYFNAWLESKDGWYISKENK